MPPGRIDTHHHFFPPAYLKRKQQQVIAMAPSHAARVNEWTPGRALEAMDQAGIATAVASIAPPGVWFGDAREAGELARECNEYAAAMAAANRGRFGVFASLPFADVASSLREIEYALDVLRADGIGLMTNYDALWPGDPRFAPIFDELNRRKAVVYFHPTAAACCIGLIPGLAPATLEFPFDTTRAIASLMHGGVLARCPDIRFIFSHGGGTIPMVAVRLAAAMERTRKELCERMPGGPLGALRKLYYDLVNVTHPMSFNAVRELAGVSQLLHGTDYPYWPTGGTAAGLAKLGLVAEDIEAIERGNALRLMPALEDRVRP
jgi:predicted TIM-barrel fold metal-dependent hydrolase